MAEVSYQLSDVSYQFLVISFGELQELGIAPCHTNHFSLSTGLALHVNYAKNQAKLLISYYI